MTASQGGGDGVTVHLNTQGTKKINTLSADLPATLPIAEESVKTFYQQVGQPRISRQKLQTGVKTIAELISQGFDPVTIVWAMTWVATHQDLFGGKVHSLALLPEVIGQALAARDIEEKRLAKQAQRTQEDHQLHTEIHRRQELERLYQALAPIEQAALRQVAVKGLLDQGIPKKLLLDGLVKGEVCRLLGEGHQDKNLCAATTTVPNHRAHAYQSQ